MEIAAAVLCSKCRAETRLPKQRWGRRCLSAYKSARYHRLRAETGPAYEEILSAEPRQGDSTTPSQTERPMTRCWMCGTCSWWEWAPGVWRCVIDGLWA